MCNNCRYTIVDANKNNRLICMNEEAEYYGKYVAKDLVCDCFNTDYTLEDATKKIMDNEYI